MEEEVLSGPRHGVLGAEKEVAPPWRRGFFSRGASAGTPPTSDARREPVLPPLECLRAAAIGSAIGRDGGGGI